MLPPYVETDLNLNQTNYVFSLRRFVFRRLVPVFTKIGLKTPKYGIFEKVKTRLPMFACAGLALDPIQATTNSDPEPCVTLDPHSGLTALDSLRWRVERRVSSIT